MKKYSGIEKFKKVSAEIEKGFDKVWADQGIEAIVKNACRVIFAEGINWEAEHTCGSGFNKIRYKYEDDLKANVTVWWNGCEYKTGNRYHEEVELYLCGKFCLTVPIADVYSLKEVGK
jgi:hypothetical protein